MNCIGVSVQQVFDHGVALGDPCAFVEHLRHGIERGEVDFPDLGAVLAQQVDGIGKRSCLHRVPEEPDAVGAWNADHGCGAGRCKPGRVTRFGECVCRIVDTADLERRIGVLNAQREDRDRFDGPAGGNDAGR